MRCPAKDPVGFRLCSKFIAPRTETHTCTHPSAQTDQRSLVPGTMFRASVPGSKGTKSFPPFVVWVGEVEIEPRKCAQKWWCFQAWFRAVWPIAQPYGTEFESCGVGVRLKFKFFTYFIVAQWKHALKRNPTIHPSATTAVWMAFS